MVVGCWGPRQQGRTSSSDYVTPVTAAPVRGCTPDCLRKPAAGSHPSSDRGFQSPVPFLKRARTQEGCKVTGVPSARPRIYPASTLARAFAIVSPFLPSSEADLPRGQPLRQRRHCQPLPPSRKRAENTEHHRRCHPRIVLPAPFLRSHGHHFRWKVLGGR